MTFIFLWNCICIQCILFYSVKIVCFMIKSAVSASFDDHHDKMVIFRSFIAQISRNSPQQVKTEVAGWKCVEDPSLICCLVAQADDTGRIFLLEITH